MPMSSIAFSIWALAFSQLVFLYSLTVFVGSVLTLTELEKDVSSGVWSLPMSVVMWQ